MGAGAAGWLLGLDPVRSGAVAGAALLLSGLVGARRRAAPTPPAVAPPDGTRGSDRLGSLMLKENLTSLGRLASGVAHEFGNPLTTISSVAQLLRRRRKDDEFVREQAEIIEAHVERLSGISRRLVDLAFPQRPKITVFDPHPVIGDTLQVARLDRRLRGMELELVVADPGLRVRSDEGALHLILLNLLFNAADAMEGRGTITISTARTELGAEIRVIDRGPGIPAEIRSRIFAPFFTTKEPGAGTGIGLPVSCRLARASDGELNLEKTGPEGSTFLLLLSVPEET